MADIVKLVGRFLYEPDSIDDIREVRKLLEAFGYQERKKSGGSECLFHKKNAYPINVPTIKGRKVKSPYIKRLARILDLEDWYEKNNKK